MLRVRDDMLILVRMHIRLSSVRAGQVFKRVGIIVRLAATVVTNIHEPIPSISLHFRKWAPVNRNLSHHITTTP
jgi:hypothetical protein